MKNFSLSLLLTTPTNSQTDRQSWKGEGLSQIRVLTPPPSPTPSRRPFHDTVGPVKVWDVPWSPWLPGSRVPSPSTVIRDGKEEGHDEMKENEDLVTSDLCDPGTRDWFSLGTVAV